MCRKICDAFGLELKVGDTVCFTLSMRKDQKPIVKAVIREFIYGKNADPGTGTYTDYLAIDFVESPAVEWARVEKKLIKKVSPDRVVKCY